MSHKSLLLRLAAALAIAVWAMPHSANAQSAVPLDKATSTAKSVATTECYACQDCLTETLEWGHEFIENDLAGENEPGATNPEFGECELPDCATVTSVGGHGHQPCVGAASASVIRAAAAAARTGDVATLARLVRENASGLRVNVARGAIQAVGCRGTLTAHIPISAQALASLS